MKKVYFTFFLIPFITNAQSRNNFFVEGGRDFSSGHLPALISVVYNFSPVSKFGLGICGEIGGQYIRYNFSTATAASEQSGNAALGDFRYYLQFTNGWLIPVFQFGYNFFDSKADVNTANFHTVGGVQSALGLTYAFKMSRGSSGFNISVKYIYRRFKEAMIYQSESTGNGYFVNGLAATIGFRIAYGVRPEK